MRAHVLLILAVGFAAAPLRGPALRAQAQTAVTPAFDAVVIKRNTSGSQSMSAESRPGGVEMMTNGPLRTLVSMAYPPGRGGMSSLPAWADAERYDMTARIVGDPSPEQRRALWRALLAERMKLAAHYESREVATFDLVPMRSDGQLGPNIKLAAVDCAARTAAAARGETLPPLPPAAPGAAPPCGSFSGAGFRRAGSITMEQLARIIPAGRPVFDKTGIAGAYDVVLEFAPQQLGAPSDLPDLFTALRDQLGLKLEPSRTPVEFLVIDRIEPLVTD